MTKSTCVVVPPKAAAVWPDSKSSIVTVPPKGMSRCVCGSTQPGSTYLPLASITLSACDVERLADQRDRLVLDVDVADVVVGRGEDPAAFDQYGHRRRVYARRVALSPSRTVDELKELRELTGDENGAQRVAWTETWATAREWLGEKLAELPVEKTCDEAGNQWFTLPGASEQALLIGGHIDSVPNGGWLDGCLNVARRASRCCAGSPRRASRR